MCVFVCVFVCEGEVRQAVFLFSCRLPCWVSNVLQES